MLGGFTSKRLTHGIVQYDKLTASIIELSYKEIGISRKEIE
jgi:hypothetical protein